MRVRILPWAPRVETEYYNYPSNAETVIEIFRGMPLDSFVPLN